MEAQVEPQAGGTAPSQAAPTTVTPGQPAAQVNVTNAMGSAANTPPDWVASLPDDKKLFVQNKGFKDPASVLDSYQNLEKLMGAPKDRIMKLPEKFDSPEMNEIYDRLGRPKNANEYNFGTPAGEKNTEFTDFAQKLFHEAGLSKAQGEKIAAKWNEYAMGDQTKLNAEKAAQLVSETAALKREWGAAFEQETKKCFAAAKAFGLGQEEVTALEKSIGYSKTMKFLNSIGSKLGEDSFVTGQQGGFQGALTPDLARAQIADLKKDKDFGRRYMAGETDAKNKMERLHRFAYPDQD